jgi:hypothetical protein
LAKVSGGKHNVPPTSSAALQLHKQKNAAGTLHHQYGLDVGFNLFGHSQLDERVVVLLNEMAIVTPVQYSIPCNLFHSGDQTWWCPSVTYPDEKLS